MRKILFSLMLVGCNQVPKYDPSEGKSVCTYDYEGICVAEGNFIVPKQIIQYAIQAVEYGFEQVNPLSVYGFEPSDTLDVLNATNLTVQYVSKEMMPDYLGVTMSGGTGFDDVIVTRYANKCRQMVYVLGHEMMHVVTNYLVQGTSHDLPWLFLQWAVYEEGRTNTIIQWEYVTEYHVWLKAAQLCNEYDNASFVSDG